MKSQIYYSESVVTKKEDTNVDIKTTSGRGELIS